MSSISAILNTARQSFLAEQTALQITAHNIANANTEGYSRQRPMFEASPFGDGVSIQTIERLHDQFLDRQMREELGAQGRLTQMAQSLRRIESLVDETEGQGVGLRLQELFSAFQDLAARPSGVAERETVRAKANVLASALNDNHRRLVGVQSDADRQIGEMVATINTLGEQIAQLNRQAQSGAGLLDETSANQIQDQRNMLVEKLSSLIQTETFEDGRGGLTVMVAGGLVLVQSDTANRLEVVPGDSNGELEIDYVFADGVRQRITDRLRTGELGGILEIRDHVVPDLRKRLDQFTAALIHEINQIHRSGVDLTGAAGGDFFDGLSVYTAAQAGNSGGAAVTASSIVDPDQLTLKEYEIRFTDPSTYDVVNVTDGTVVSSGNAYVSGTPIVFDGISVEISDVGGSPAAGDVFAVNTFSWASAGISVAGSIVNSIEAIAAGLSAEAGDNRNALELAALGSSLVAPGGRSTLGEYYSSILTDLGIQVNQVSAGEDRQNMLVDQTRNLILNLSGVSIDEESANLIRFQRAFDASARVISLVDEMYQTILDILP